MAKVMLVLENSEDMDFLKKILTGLGLEVIVMRKGEDITEKLIDHLPDIVFASTLGRNQKILTTLHHIKKTRGKPRLVYIRNDKDMTPLSSEQRKIIDGALHSPIDPVQLIDVVASTTSLEIEDLKKRYKQMRRFKDKDLDIDQSGITEGDKDSTTKDHFLIHDPGRKEKYDKIYQAQKLARVEHKQLNTQELRQRQKLQMAELKEDKAVEKERKHFIKTLFSMDPKK